LDQVDIELPSAYDTLPSTTVDWNDLLGVQGGMDWNLSETMPTSELELPEQNGAINGTWLRSPKFGSDTKTTNPITGFWEATQPLDHPDLFHNEIKIRRGFEGIVGQSCLEALPFTASDAKRRPEADIRSVLCKHDMSEYFPAFLEQGFDTWEAIYGITESDFEALGVKLGHRRRLQSVISKAMLTLGSRAETHPANTDCSTGNDREPGLSQFNTEKSFTSRYKTENGRKRVAKMFNINKTMPEESYPGYQVWDSRSSISASSSISSAPSRLYTTSIGRRGPLSSAARARANAVKAVKACWRCKFMGKPVSVWVQI